MKKALAVLMTLALLLMAIPTLAQEKVAPLTVTFDLNTTQTRPTMKPISTRPLATTNTGSL